MSSSAPRDYGDVPYSQKVEIDEICDRFEDKLKSGQQTRAEEHLELADQPARSTLIRELLSIEVEYRRESPHVVRAEYEARFPQLRHAIQSTLLPGPHDGLAPGIQLGDFRVQQRIGAGGMGVVYEAFDVKLERNVALKVLPSEFARDLDRVERFEREAKILAALNHPNIATLHGFEEHQGIRFFVLELVPGMTLAELIDGRPLPPDEVKIVFGQIAKALEAAHGQGIIHRDLKPANVKVTSDGIVKVLDFGLATSFQVVDLDQDISLPLGVLSTSTVASGIAGTVPYMSPEQARGKPVDKRTDVWAFGCCLYEAVTGQRAFDGPTAADVLAAIVQRDPDWRALPERATASVRLALHRCLQKDPERRLRDVGDALIDDACIDDLLRPTSTGSGTARSRFRRWTIPALVAAVVATLAIWSSHLISRPSAQPARMLNMVLPETAPVAVASLAPFGEGRPSIALTPDGSRLVYVANIDGVAKLCVRPMDLRREATVIDGTDGAFNPFLSPDGEWVGFFTAHQLKKVPLAGGRPVPLCGASFPFGASWADNGYIYFSEGFGSALSRVVEQGGTKEQIASGVRDNAYIWPEVLPGGKGVLVYRQGSGIVRVMPDGEETLVLHRGTHARYVPSGHLVYALPGRLMAVAFDLDRLRAIGEPIPVADSVRTECRGAAQFCTAQDGSMVYLPGGDAALAKLVEREIHGEAERDLGFPKKVFGTFQLAPVGRRIAIQVREPKDDIWIFDLERPNQIRLTYEGNNERPIWSPDGDAVVFASDRHGSRNLFLTSADRSGDVERLTVSEHYQTPADWSMDGTWLAYGETNKSDIMMLSVATKQQRPLLRTSENGGMAAFSPPDGRWIAYTIFDEMADYHVWMRPCHGPGHARQVSTEAGEEPVWSPSGDRIYYRNGQKWMAVSVQTQPGLKLGPPELLFEDAYYLNVPGRSYDVTPDGQHFVMLRGEEDPAPTQLQVVQNWFDELRQLAPPSSR